MKNIFLVLTVLINHSLVFSQNHLIDSLRNRMLYSETDTTKIDFTNDLAIEYRTLNPDSAYLLSMQAYKKSSKINYIDGMSRSATIIGGIYNDAGNYSKALEYYLKKLKAEEKRNNPEILTVAIMQIATVYQLEGEYKKAAAYAFRADSIIDAQKLSRLKLYSLINLGDLFEKAGNIQLAKDYTKKAYALSLKENNIAFIGTVLNNFGNIYSKSNNTTLAIQNYTNAIPYLESTNDHAALAETTLGLARQYKLISLPDSSLFYANKSYELCKKNGLLDKQLSTCLFLTEYYKGKGDIKNAFIFQEEVLMLKDDIYSKDRIAKTQLLTIEEELRQKEIGEKKLEEAKDRKMKIQYLTIGLLLPILFFITLYLSNRKIKPKYIEFLGLVSLLLTFEYIMLLLHPLIVKITHHIPIYQLMIFAVIASVLTPLHHRMENWLMKILTKKERVSLMKIRIQ